MAAETTKPSCFYALFKFLKLELAGFDGKSGLRPVSFGLKGRCNTFLNQKLPDFWPKALELLP